MINGISVGQSMTGGIIGDTETTQVGVVIGFEANCDGCDVDVGLAIESISLMG